MFKNNEHKEHIKKLFMIEPKTATAGLMFGFPDCCIEGFIDDENKDTKKQYDHGPYMGTGLIPCLCCAKSIEENNNWDEFQENINKNRKIKSKFPEEGDFNELDRYFYSVSIALNLNPLESALLADDENIIKIVKEEITLAKKEHTENNLMLNFIEKNKNIGIENIYDLIIEEPNFKRFILAKIINNMICYTISEPDPKFRYIEKKPLSYLNTKNKGTLDSLLADQIKDNLQVVFRHLPKEHNAYNLMEELVENLYNYSLIQTLENVKVLKPEDKKKIKYIR